MISTAYLQVPVTIGGALTAATVLQDESVENAKNRCAVLWLTPIGLHGIKNGIPFVIPYANVKACVVKWDLESQKESAA